MSDVKSHCTGANRLLEICPGLDGHVTQKFNGMLWNLMENASNMTQLNLEPMYSTLNPKLPNFHPLENDNHNGRVLYEKGPDGNFFVT